MFSTIIDNAIGVFSPRWAATRMAYRHRMIELRAATGVHESMRRMLGGGKSGGYEAGKLDRLKGRLVGSPHENDIPREQIKALRWRSWNLYRNCPQARKVVRTLNAKVIGRGLSPQPQATKRDGTPFVEFNKRAHKVFAEFSKESDYRGKPGAGGQSFVGQSKTAFRSVGLSGGTLYQFHRLTKEQQKRLGLYVPLQIQLLHIDRLDDRKHGSDNFHGVGVDSEGRVNGFNVMNGGAKGTDDSQFVPVSEMRHLFAEEDIDQLLGAPWFGAALLTMDDRRQYEYTELVAAEMASCIVGGYRRSNGQSGGIGLRGGQDGDRDLTDADGNPVTRLQPGMFLDLGQTGEIQIEGANRPNANIGEVLQHFIRSEAVSVPGVKSSTLTGDYRNSSFSSERSADNDIWPEIEDLQDWFAASWCQPIYEECISTAVIAGLFDDIAGFTAVDFGERKRDYLNAVWQGPVSRSINPRDDAEAARLRVKNANSTPQLEAAKLGLDSDQILDDIKAFIDKCKERQLPDDIWQQALGIEQKDHAPIGEQRPTEQQQDDAMQNRIRNFTALNRA